MRAGVRSACRACTAKKAKARRETASPIDEEARRADAQKRLVRRRTRAFMRAGLLLVEPCAVCGSVHVEAHHEDYSAKDAHLHVTWLCRVHHAEQHATKPWIRQLELWGAL